MNEQESLNKAREIAALFNTDDDTVKEVGIELLAPILRLIYERGVNQGMRVAIEITKGNCDD